MNRALYGTTAVAGVGIRQYKRGKSPLPERSLLVEAILAACEEAGFDPADIDGFVSYGDDKNEPVRLMPELGPRNCACRPPSGAAAAAASPRPSGLPRARS